MKAPPYRAGPPGLVAAGVRPLLARLARRASPRQRARYSHGPLAPSLLKNLDQGARLLATPSPRRSASWSSPTTTPTARPPARSACATCLRRRRQYLVPDRFKLGYGLTPELVDLAAARKPDILMSTTASQRRRRSARQRARHRHADHRPSPSRRGAAGGGVHRQSEPARLRISLEGAGGVRGDVLPDGRPASRAQEKKA
jgi:hypothetical protein